ncbi:MAG: DegQ family serine endoprotease [Planctomycetes bacterium]|nr:DegQ family serine endoprotease [Planctomycetota bacterium]
MNPTKSSRRPRATLLVRTLAVLAPLLAAPAFAQEPQPLPTSGVTAAVEAGGTISFAPVVKQVAQSVVTVATSKAVKRNVNLPPGVDERMLRRFFAPGGEQDGQDEPAMHGMHDRRMQGLGSGVVVSADGYILTNNHVVEGADTVKVTFAGSHAEYDAKVVGADAKTDLAVLKIDAGHTLPAIAIGDSAKAEVGDLVLAIGNPFGVGQTVTMGIISARGRGVGLADYEDFLQTDASINPGNSGGALVDAKGRLIGINTAILSPSGGNLGIGFAVPINLAHEIMTSIISKGGVTRGYLGLMIQPVDDDLAKALKLPNDEGALVGDAVADGPAAKAGIKAGDVVVSFNGTAIDEPRHLRLLAAQTAPGTKAKLGIVRDGKPMTIDLTVQELPGGEAVAAKGHGERDGHAAPVKLGVHVVDLDAQVRERLDIPSDIEGALIAEVAPGSRAEQAGLKRGEVILEIDRQPIGGAKDAVAAIGASKGAILLRLWTKQGARYVVAPPMGKEPQDK